MDNLMYSLRMYFLLGIGATNEKDNFIVSVPIENKCLNMQLLLRRRCISMNL